MKRALPSSLVRVVAAGAVGLAGAVPPAGAQETVAITNATIHTVSGGVIENGTIVLRDGRIAAVGTAVDVPTGARIIDGTGRIVTPGFVDSYTQIGLIEIGGQAPGTNDHTTTEASLGASFNPLWGVNPRNTLIPNNRIRGITGAVVHPGGNKLFNGQGALIALDGATLDAMTRSESVAVYAAMGEAGAGTAGGSRAANYIELRNALWDARAKMIRDDRGDTDDKAGKAADETEQDTLAKGGRSDITAANLDVLERVARTELPLVLAADRESDIRLALKLGEDFDIRIILVGAREGWRLASDIAEAGVPVIVNPLVDLPDFEGLSSTYANAGRLQQAGVDVILSTFTSHQIRDLTYGAGLAVSYGMDHAAALRAVTLAPAEAWGVADRMGSLDVGKVADVVVWSGDPFELSTSAEHVFIGGAEVPQDSRQKMLFHRYRTLPPGG